MSYKYSVRLKICLAPARRITVARCLYDHQVAADRVSKKKRQPIIGWQSDWICDRGTVLHSCPEITAVSKEVTNFVVVDPTCRVDPLRSSPPSSG